MPPDDIHADAVIVGGGPAGLRAAELLAGGGRRVMLCEGKPSVGRKFLVAGRGGLNLTNSENQAAFAARYGESESARWRGLLSEFGPVELRAWASELGVETYVGTSGRVFPHGQQAAGLLRRWVGRLRESGVVFQVNRYLEGLTAPGSERGWQLVLRDPRTNEMHRVAASAVILALGGASWPQTGSDGRWPALLHGSLDVRATPWQPANCGWEIAWDPRVLAMAEGLPLKNIALSANGRTVAGEALITRYGLEGGALYQLGRELRAMPAPGLHFDFKPGVSEEKLFARLPRSGRASSWEEAARCWRLGEAARALLEFHGPAFDPDGSALTKLVKRFPLTLRGPRPVEEAISSAGGVPWTELDDDLMLTRHPGIFVAGEMIDWEAPTGGYLLQGSFSTGTRAARGAKRYLDKRGISRDTSPSA